MTVLALVIGFAGLAVSPGQSDGVDWQQGEVHLRSIGALTFGPPGVLFVADPEGAAVFAFDTGDTGKGEVGFERLAPLIARAILSAR
jgi:hypothetical protein